MKIISVILMLAYLMLPAICFGHPCDELSANAQHASSAVTQSDDCPVNYDSDNCETTCCCAGHLPASSITPPYPSLTGKQLSYEPRLALPRILDRIFVPPQNHPESIPCG
jgi:hypothetical protein